MAATISALEGQLNLNPKLSTIAEDKKKGNNGEKGGKKFKNKKDSSNKKYQKKDEVWKKVPPKDSTKKTTEVGMQVHLQLLQAPYGMDSPQTFGLHIGPEAQGWPEERQQQ